MKFWLLFVLTWLSAMRVIGHKAQRDQERVMQDWMQHHLRYPEWPVRHKREI